MYKNKLLVANSVIQDPIFAGSVIFLFGHNKKGAEGVILNSREVGKVGFGQMQDLFNAAPGSFNEAKDMILNGKLQSVPLFLGGPCQTPGIYFLHGYEEFLNILEGPEDKSEFDLGIPTSFNLFGEDEAPAYNDSPSSKMVIMDGLYFGTPYTFGHIIEAGKLEENKFRFFTGQAGWGPGQLEHEIAHGAWTIMDATGDLIFDAEAIRKLAASVGKEAVQHTHKKGLNIPGIKMPKLPPGFDPSWN